MSADKDFSGTFGAVRQIGVVVRDLDKAMLHLHSLLGISPKKVGETPPGDKRFHGVPEDFSARLAWYDFDNVELEMIQPMRGKSLWQEYLDTHGEGIHHILFYTDSFNGLCDHMSERGVSLLQDGPSSNYPGCHWGYLGTADKIGFDLEINNPPEKGYNV